MKTVFTMARPSEIRHLKFSLCFSYPLRCLNKREKTYFLFSSLFNKKETNISQSDLTSDQISRSVVSDSATPWTTARQASLSIKLPESTQTHVHQVSDAIQLSHPLSSPSSPAFNPSQHQGLFQWVSSSHQVAKVLEFQLQHQSFQWTPRTDLL